MLRLLLLSFLLAAVSPATAAPLLYRVGDADTTVWLLGSVHALTAADYPLDARIENAYANAERVVLEVSPGELDPAHISQVALPLATYPDGQQLADAFTPSEYASLRNHFETFGLDIRQLRNFEPWFVGLQVFALHLAQSDYVSGNGVDQHFASRALADGKLSAGLETAAEQLGFFDALPAETQKAFLLESIGDSSDFASELDAIITAWRQGDEAALTTLAEAEFGGDAGLRDALLVERNRRWLPQIEELLRAEGDSLVIVGTLHLVGDESVVKLLENEGYEVKKVTRVPVLRE